MFLCTLTAVVVTPGTPDVLMQLFMDFFLSSLQIEYKKGSKESQAQYTLPMDMINLSHAKKAQALASDLEYRTKLHEYTVMADDIKIQQAKKAYSLQSEVQDRRKRRTIIFF